MTEMDINGWSVKRDREDSIILTSDGREVFANRSSQESTVQTWFVNADLPGQEPKSWKVTVESRRELIMQRLPEILHSLDN